MKHISSKSSIFFATFSRYEHGNRLPTNGMVEPVLSYFLPRVRSLVLLDLPHLVSDTIDPVVEVYESGTRVKKYTLSKFLYFPIYLICKIPSKKETRISYKLRDFFSVFWVAWREHQAFDLFIGLESIHALAGIILRAFGKVDTVVYYVSDYAPNRFKNVIFNTMYLWLDRFCVTHADFTWDVSPAMQEGRIIAGLPKRTDYRVIHVPNALFPAQIAPLPRSKQHAYHLVYMGIMQPDMGPDLAIRAFKRVVLRYPKAILHLIGGSEKDLRVYRALVKQLQLDKSVRFYGFVARNTDMADIVRHCSIGLAPYRAFPDSLRWYGDAGKIRQYTAAGLPVVTTHVPPLGRYVVKHGAGIMTNDTEEEFADGILALLENRKLYETLRVGAIRVSRNNTWDRVYGDTLEKMYAFSSKTI